MLPVNYYSYPTVVVVRLSQRVILCHFHISPALELLELGMAQTSIVNGQVRIWPGFGLKTVPGATNLVLGSQVHFHPMPEPDRCMIAFPQYIEQRWHATFFLGPKLDSWVEALLLSPAADKTSFFLFPLISVTSRTWQHFPWTVVCSIRYLLRDAHWQPQQHSATWRFSSVGCWCLWLGCQAHQLSIDTWCVAGCLVALCCLGGYFGMWAYVTKRRAFTLPQTSDHEMRSSDRQLQQHHYNEIHWSHQAGPSILFVSFLLGDLGWLLRPEVKFIPWTAILKLPVPWPRCQDISALVAKFRVNGLLKITPRDSGNGEIFRKNGWFLDVFWAP